MNLPMTIRELSRELKVSLAEIARRTGQSPQNLSKKMNKETLSFDDFEQILKSLGVGMDVKFTLPGGDTVSAGGNDEVLRRQMKILEMQLEVERMKNRYFSDISFRYRTALETVSGGLGIARNHVEDTKKVSNCIDKVLPAVAELTRLIEDSPFNREAGIAPEKPEAAIFSADARLAEKRILLVDDNDLNREIVRELLEDSGIVVEEAGNGQDSLDKIDSHPDGYYDMVLMDLIMPVMDGFTAAAEIRKREAGKDASLPIIAMTASVGGEERTKAAEAGMNGFIEKPLRLEQLSRVMSRI